MRKEAYIQLNRNFNGNSPPPSYTAPFSPSPSLKQQRLVAEGMENLHCECSLPERFVTVQEPHKHGKEDLALSDLGEGVGKGEREREREREKERERGRGRWRRREREGEGKGRRGWRWSVKGERGQGEEKKLNFSIV